MNNETVFPPQGIAHTRTTADLPTDSGSGFVNAPPTREKCRRPSIINPRPYVLTPDSQTCHGVLDTPSSVSTTNGQGLIR
jgi:hypothetical protein